MLLRHVSQHAEGVHPSNFKSVPLIPSILAAFSKKHDVRLEMFIKQREGVDSPGACGLTSFAGW